MKKNTQKRYIQEKIICIILLFSLSACVKSINPGDWDILPKQTEEPEPEVPDEEKTITLKVMSYNARTTDANAGPLFTDLKAYIKEYNPDLLLLRQVDSATTRALKINRPLEVATETGMNVFFAKAIDYQTGGYGNAVLSKFPILSSKSIKVTGGTEVRSLASITVKIDEFNNLTFLGTELDPLAVDRNESNRIAQVQQIMSYTNSLTNPTIFVGNFNFNRTGEGYDKIKDTQVYDYVADQFTFACLSLGCVLNTPVANPTSVFDYVSFKPSDSFKVSNYTTGTKTTSTFLPVIAQLKLTLKEK